MTNDRLQDIITQENEQREENTLRTARELINRIINRQGVIAAATAEIEECRKELKALEVTTLNASEVLGE